MAKIKDTKILDNYSNIPFNYDALSRNENISLDYIKNNKNKDWNWSIISLRDDISINDICENEELPWDQSIVTFRFYTRRLVLILYASTEINTMIYGS